ncbi:MAG TPA: hypothetical protein VEU08_10320 [Vicinamibacterales bacterium]|nr:hypothetical protein [Vicinamibacterales bacterium]
MTARGGWRDVLIAALGFSALTVVFTFPLAFHLGSLGRVDNGDGQFSVWNVAWVARALVVDPRHVFNANIFYPHTLTLAYSESNLGAGALAVPVYWATRNPYAAHNAVLLVSFVLGGVGMYCLVRHLTADRVAAGVAGIAFSFCPYLSSHLPHIQLLWTAGLPFAALALHRVADRPTAGRAAALGLVIAAQSYFCGYYAVFVALVTGFATLALAWSRGVWTSGQYWTAVGGAAAIAIAVGLPVIVPYVEHQRATGFARTLDNARLFSATWRSFISSPSYVHSRMTARIGDFGTEQSFPGFVAVVFGAFGAVSGWRLGGRFRETAGLYAAIGALALWSAFGPSGRLYSALYAVIPVFSFLRAPGRFAIVVDFALCVLAGLGVAAVLARTRRPALAGGVIACVAFAEMLVPFNFPRVPPVDEGYRVLASLPVGPVLELPVYSPKFAFVREEYMLASTIHWMPLIDAYSDYIPPDFVEAAERYADFPSREAFDALRPLSARYAVFHPDKYDAAARASLMDRLREYAPFLRQRYAGDRLWVYEISGFPTAAR